MTQTEIKAAVFEALTEYERQKNRDRLYTINQVSKRLNVSHATITKKVKAGLINVTPDNLITERAIESYLSKV